MCELYSFIDSFFASSTFQIKSNFICVTKIQIPTKEVKRKSNVPTGHKGSKSCTDTHAVLCGATYRGAAK